MIGAISTRTATPASDSSLTARSRAAGVLVRGSIDRARAGIERGDAEMHAHQIRLGHRPENVQVAQHQGVLGHDSHRLLSFQGDFQAAARQTILPLGRLIAIGDPRHGDQFRLPALAAQELAEQLGGLFLDQNLGLEVQPGTPAQIFMVGPGITIGAAVGTSAVGIDAVTKTDVGAVIFADESLGIVGYVFGRPIPQIVRGTPDRARLARDRLRTTVRRSDSAG